MQLGGLSGGRSSMPTGGRPAYRAISAECVGAVLPPEIVPAHHSAMKRRQPSAAWAARRIAELDRQIQELEKPPAPGMPWHQRSANQVAWVRAMTQRSHLQRYLPREAEGCDLPF